MRISKGDMGVKKHGRVGHEKLGFIKRPKQSGVNVTDSRIGKNYAAKVMGSEGVQKHQGVGVKYPALSSSEEARPRGMAGMIGMNINYPAGKVTGKRAGKTSKVPRPY